MRSLGRSLGIVLIVLPLNLAVEHPCAVAQPLPATDPASSLAPVPVLPPPKPPAPGSGPAGTAFLWNISSQTLHYRLRRARGLTWTEQRVLAPGEKVLFTTENSGDLFGVGPNTDPRFIVIEYYAMGGLLRQRLSSRSYSDPEVLLPYYFFIEDADGVGWFYQGADETKAQAFQEKLKYAGPLAASEFGRRLDQLQQIGSWRPLSAEALPAPPPEAEAPAPAEDPAPAKSAVEAADDDSPPAPAPAAELAP